MKFNKIYREAYPNAVGYHEPFVINRELLKEFKSIEYSPFRVPCIFGYVKVTTTTSSDG